jgi:two-component system, OmpR family, sensor kinase
MLKRIEISFQNENEIKEKMKKFIADASHELKTPITSIHGFAEVLNMGAAKDENQLKASLDTIMSESDRLTRLLNNLLLITRLDQGRGVEMKPESLKQIIMEVYPQLQIMAGLKKLELNLQEDLIINANKDEIKQIIINLVQNAVKYTPKHGEIKISLKIVIKNREKYAEFIIEDNGMGIPQEKMDAVFDRFYRVEEHRARNKGGYGLGLSIVKEIVSRHGGEILVKSAVGKGAAFLIYFRA